MKCITSHQDLRIYFQFSVIRSGVPGQWIRLQGSCSSSSPPQEALSSVWLQLLKRRLSPTASTWWKQVLLHSDHGVHSLQAAPSGPAGSQSVSVQHCCSILAVSSILTLGAGRGAAAGFSGVPGTRLHPRRSHGTQRRPAETRGEEHLLMFRVISELFLTCNAAGFPPHSCCHMTSTKTRPTNRSERRSWSRRRWHAHLCRRCRTGRNITTRTDSVSEEPLEREMVDLLTMSCSCWNSLPVRAGWPNLPRNTHIYWHRHNVHLVGRVQEDNNILNKQRHIYESYIII